MLLYPKMIENCTIYESEVALFENLRQTYREDTRGRIVDDGLCWAAISKKMRTNQIGIGLNVFGQNRNAAFYSFLKNQIKMKVKIIRIGIGRMAQEHLVMF